MGAALFSMNPPPQVGQGSDSLSSYKLTVRHSTLGVSARIAETARMFDGSGCTHTHTSVIVVVVLSTSRCRLVLVMSLSASNRDTGLP